jgi:NitT/TauT family transport system substrate-binding protein
MRHGLLSLLAAAAMAVAVSTASAQDAFKVAIGQLEIWSGQAPILGAKAGIFKKHGITVENFGTAGAGETVQAVISGSADFGVNVGTQGVLRAFAKGALIRVISGLHRRGRYLLYVRASSIKSLKDTTERNTISYSTGGSTTHTIVLGLGKELGINGADIDRRHAGADGGRRARSTSAGIATVWAQEIEDGKNRVIAGGNDVLSLRSQTIRVETVNANVEDPQGRRAAICARLPRNARLDVCRPRRDQDVRRCDQGPGRDREDGGREIPAQGSQAVRPHPGPRGIMTDAVRPVSRCAAQQGAGRGVHPDSPR